MSREMTVLSDTVLITCIVQRGVADRVVRAAREAGAQGATVFFARGTGVRERLGLLGIAVEVEKEVITIVVAAEQANRIFEKMYFAGDLDTPGMGILYMTVLDKAATYIPHEVVEQLAKKNKVRSTGPAKGTGVSP